MTANTKNFELSLEKLEKIVGELESGELTLEKSLDKFEQGIKHYKECKSLLNKAEVKIKKLTDELKEEDLEE